jgi:hypothetical protein
LPSQSSPVACSQLGSASSWPAISRTLAQRAADRSLQALRQSLHDVARVVNLAALDRRLAAKTAPDRPRQRLRAVDDEQPRQLDQARAQSSYRWGARGARSPFMPVRWKSSGRGLGTRRCREGRATDPQSRTTLGTRGARRVRQPARGTR